MVINNDSDLEKITKSGEYTKQVREKVINAVKAGISTKELEDVAKKEIDSIEGAESSFLGFKEGGNIPYPSLICVSVNEEVVHGIPGDRVIKEGDLVTVDCGINYKGFHTDSAYSVIVGEGDKDTRRLVEATKTALKRALKVCKAWNRLSDIGREVEKTAKEYKVTVIRDLGGHGIGKSLHEEPVVSNYYSKDNDKYILEEGLVLAIEPIFSLGEDDLEVYEDRYTLYTKDNKRACQFEHTVIVKKGGCVILT